MKKLKFDSYDGVCFLNGLVFFAPVALLVRTQAGGPADDALFQASFSKLRFPSSLRQSPLGRA